MKKSAVPQGVFIKAVYTGDVAAVKKMLAAGADPNLRWETLSQSKKQARGAHQEQAQGHNQAAETPLWFAAVCGRREVAELLLKAGAAIDGGQAWMTPAFGAALSGHADLAEWLIKQGAQAHFLAQVALGRLAAVKRALAKQPALAQIADEYGRTGLHVAARRLDVPMARFFLSQGVPVDALTQREETPLYLACDRRGVDVDGVEAKQQRALLQVLIDAGADVQRGNVRGVTPLHVAVRARSVGAVEVLLKHGANKNAREKYGRGRGRGSTPQTRAKFSTGAGGTKGRKAEGEAIRRLLAAAGAR